jgi:membrane associated rhomboid family serine protease
VIPLGAELPTTKPPVMTYAILAAMAATWVFVQGAGMNETQLVTSVCNLGMVPGELTHLARVGTAVSLGNGMACVVDREPINILTPLISMFLHGGWAHLLGNALFFWVFGRNVENAMGSVRFLAFYLICGLVAAAAQVMFEPSSPIPTIGASGAISGVLGAYLIDFPRVRIKMLFWFIIFFKVFRIPAWAVLVYWFALQLFMAMPDLQNVNGSSGGGGIAVWAHIGGFIAGILLVRFFSDPRRLARPVVWS